MKKRFKLKTKSKRFFENNKFKLNTGYSTEGDEYYSLFFPVCTWLEYTTLWGELRVQANTGYVWVDVYDNNLMTKTKYAPFYYVESGDFDPLLKSIWDKIYKKMNDLGIVEVREYHGNKNKVHQKSEWRNDRTTEKNTSRRLDRSQSSRGRDNERGRIQTDKPRNSNGTSRGIRSSRSTKK